jgi:hypothetical protein
MLNTMSDQRRKKPIDFKIYKSPGAGSQVKKETPISFKNFMNLSTSRKKSSTRTHSLHKHDNNKINKFNKQHSTSVFSPTLKIKPFEIPTLKQKVN